MAKIPDGTFKNWQDNEIIHATEYVQEREMLRVAANDNSERLDELETVTNALGLDSVQLSKITNDTGGVKLNITDTFKNLLDELHNLGQGMHTFYAVSGTKGLPPTNISTRGIAHFTSATIGWVYATDYKNNIFTNYYDTNKWLGWNRLVSADEGQTQLWSGKMYVNENQTISPSQKLSQCRNGWVLEWSDFDPPTTENDFDYHYSYIIKDVVKSKWVVLTIPSYVNETTGLVITPKLLKFTDSTITGSSINGAGTPLSGNDVVLRRVLEW